MQMDRFTTNRRRPSRPRSAWPHQGAHGGPARAPARGAARADRRPSRRPLRMALAGGGARIVNEALGRLPTISAGASRQRPRAAGRPARRRARRPARCATSISAEHLLLAVQRPAPPADASPATTCRLRARGSRLAPASPPGSRGHLRGARSSAAPDRGGRGGQARPRDRARRRDPPRHPGALPPHKNNPVLIGEPGVGKTAIVKGLAQRIVDDDVPESLTDRRVIALDIGSLLAGSKSRRVRGAPGGRPEGDPGGPRRSSCSWTSCTRSLARGRPRAQSTPRTCSSRCSPASCARSAPPRSMSTRRSRRTP